MANVGSWRIGEAYYPPDKNLCAEEASLSDPLLDKLTNMETRYEELNNLMVQPDVIADPSLLERYGREYAGLEPLVTKYRDLKETLRQRNDTEEMLGNGLDDDLRALAREELDRLRRQADRILDELKTALRPKDVMDERNVIMTIQAGAGGDEAGLFAADLFRMYSRYAEDKHWNLEVLDSNESGIGGFKEIVFEVTGRGAYSRFKYESGVHRVQRVPETEAQGRIHTSTATVAVLPEVEDVDIHIDEKDIREDKFHSGGAGGQNVNKVETAVRVVHKPTGITVKCQQERSQLMNKALAMELLRSKLLAIKQSERDEELARLRGESVSATFGNAIRSYVLDDRLVKDVRTKVETPHVESVLNGDLDQFIEAYLRQKAISQSKNGSKQGAQSPSLPDR